MTTVGGPERIGRLSYWRLTPAERSVVRRVERTCRATGDQRLDTIALTRLRRAAGRARLLGPLARRLSGRGPGPQERIGRLCSTMRHPSRTGVCTGGTS
jgi:hypothetical protein